LRRSITTEAGRIPVARSSVSRLIVFDHPSNRGSRPHHRRGRTGLDADHHVDGV